jgi:hypothetical protein
MSTTALRLSTTAALRKSTTAALLVCLLGTGWGGATVFASGEEAASNATGPARLAVTAPLDGHRQLLIDASRFTLADEESAFAQRRGFRGRGRNEGARTAIVLGTLAAITGAALLVYANRPQCSANPSADACGYGTKVIGGAVLTAGTVGIVAGTISWR